MIAVNVLVKPIWILFIDREVQNRVGAAEYGSYSAMLGLSIMFSILLDFGITNYNSRTVSQNPDELRTVFSSMLTARLLLILSYIALVCGVALVLGYRAQELMMLCGVLLIQSLNYLLLFIRSNVAALQKFRTDGLLSVTDRFLMILVCGSLLLFPGTGRHFRVEWFIIAQVACYFTACIIAYAVLRHIHEVQLRLSFHWPTILRIMKDSSWYALFIFLMSVYIRSDMQMIKWIAGAEQVGIYAASYRLLDVSINMFGSMFAAVLLPLFGRMLAQKQDVNPIITLCVNVMLPVSFIVSVGAAFYGVPVMHVLYPAADNYWASIFGWVMASFPAFSIMYVYSTLLTANGNMKILSAIALGGAVVNIALNSYLIAHHKALGAAITCFVTETAVGIAYIFFCNRRLHVHLPAKWVGAHLLFLVLLSIAGYGTTLISAGWIVQVAVFTVVSIMLVLLFGFISVQGIKMLFLSKGKG